MSFMAFCDILLIMLCVITERVISMACGVAFDKLFDAFFC